MTELVESDTTVERLLLFHPFLSGLERQHVAAVADCGRSVAFEPGEVIFRADEPAEHFYLIRTGTVSVEVREEGRRSRSVQSIKEGDVLGWSWLFPPRRWHFWAVAETVTRAVEIDAGRLLARCEEDREMGYQLVLRVAAVMADRLHATRFRMLELSRGWR